MRHSDLQCLLLSTFSCISVAYYSNTIYISKTNVYNIYISFANVLFGLINHDEFANNPHKKGMDIDMITKYGIFCKVIETESFTKTAEIFGYTQSAVSQTVKALETELNTTLVNRKKGSIYLTADGEQYFPFIQSIASAEDKLEHKKQEMQGLMGNTIKIGTFTSVSRNILPRLMKEFKKKYPEVNFVLSQGEYTTIIKWIKEGTVDFGFINADADPDMNSSILYRDEMVAVLPKGHSLAPQNEVSLHDLATEPLILLDEGDYSVTAASFQAAGILPNLKYQVYDDYSILSMVKQGLGISLMYKLVLEGFEEGLEIRPITEKPERPVAIGWLNWDTMPLASRKFADYILKRNKQNGLFS